MKIRPTTAIKRSGGPSSYQTGVTSVLFVLLLTSLVAVLFLLAVDGNRLYDDHRQLQNQTNAAAIAAANFTQACYSANASFQPNTGFLQTKAWLAAKKAGFQGDKSAVTVVAGVLAPVNGITTFEVRPPQQSNSVHVELTRKEPYSVMLSHVFANSTFDMTTEATAQKQVIGTLSSSGVTANIGGDPNRATLLNSLLGAIILGPGQRFNLDPTDYTSLSNALVSVGDLLDKLGVDNLTDALDLRGDQLASALRNIAGVTSPAGELLDGLLQNAGLDTLKVSDILQVVGNAQVPDDTKLPLYGMITALALNLSNHAVFSFPNTGLNIPGLTNVSAKLHVGNPPKIVIGPAIKKTNGDWATKFEAADVSLSVKSQLNVGVPGFSLIHLTLPLAVKTGGGEGQLVAADCRTGVSNAVVFQVKARAFVGKLATGDIDPQTGVIHQRSVDANVLQILGASLLGVHINLDATIPASPMKTLTFNANLHDLTQPGYQAETKTLGGGINGLLTNLDVRVDLLFIPNILPGLLNGLTDLVEGLLRPLVQTLGQAVLTPLLNGLGLELGKLSVTLSGAHQTTRLIPGAPGP